MTNAGEILTDIEKEMIRAHGLYGPLRSAHEAYGVILEEVDEMWDEIKNNDINKAREEAIQAAAMILRFLIDIK